MSHLSVLNSVIALTLASTLLITGCNSSDDSSEQPPIEDLSSTDDLQIRQSAAEIALESLTNNLNNSAQLADDPIPAVDSPTLNPITGDNVTGMDDTNQASAGQFNTESNSFLNTSLGLDENSQAEVTQNGNQITIDPNDEDLCREELAGSSADQEAFDACVVLAADLIIQIDAQTEEIGVITYFFQGIPTITIGYSPTTSSYELNFAGVQAYQTAYDDLTNQQMEGSSQEGTTISTTYAGILRLSTSFDPENKDVGKMVLDVIETVQIKYFSTSTSNDNFTSDTSWAPGTILSVETFAGSGNGVVELNWGTYNTKYENNYNNETYTSEGQIPGLTGRMELTKEGSELKVSNLALTRGPVTVTVDSVEQFRATLESLGFTLNDSDGELVLDTNLNFSSFTRTENYSFSSDTFEETITEETSRVNLSAIAGTGLLGQIASTKVTQGGPFNISLETSVDNAAPSSKSLSVEAGQCFGDDENGSAAIVACDDE